MNERDANYGIYAERDWPAEWKRNGKDNAVLAALEVLQQLGANLRNTGKGLTYSAEHLLSLREELQTFRTDLNQFFLSQKPYPFDVKAWKWDWLTHGYENCVPAAEEALLYLSDPLLEIEDEVQLSNRLLKIAQALETTRNSMLDVPEVFVERVVIPASDLPDSITIQDLSAFIGDAQQRHLATMAQWSRERLQRGAIQGASGDGVVMAGEEGALCRVGGGKGGHTSGTRGTGVACAGGGGVGVGGYTSGRGGQAHLEPDDARRLRKAIQLGKEGTAHYNGIIAEALFALEDSGLKGQAEALRDIRGLLLPNPA